MPASLTYDEDRWDPVESLLAHVSAVHRMAGDGTVHVLPSYLRAPVWTIAGGQDGVLAGVARTLDDDRLYNAVVSRGQTEAGVPLVGRAYLTGGPLKWGATEPFGRRPMFHQAIATTSGGVRANAVTTLDTTSSAGQIDLPVVCLTHPGIQMHDTVTVIAATTQGDAPLIGRVVGMRISSAGAVPAKSMTLTVRVTVQALEAVAARVAGARG